MRAVQAEVTLPGSVHEAESCWYDTTRWPSWVDGLARVLAVEPGWPRAGSSVRWESGPAGRGRVVERVVAYEQLAGQTLEVEDDSIRGRQSVAFTPEGNGVEVELRLEYEIKRRTIVTPLIDILFIRRLMAASLRRTLARFGAQLATAQQSGVR